MNSKIHYSLLYLNALFLSILFGSIIGVTSCNAPGYTTSGDSMTGRETNARNWVIIMHGEPCGNADDVAHNMYVENNHETKSITVTVDISWTENNQPRHENKIVSVAPDSKTLIECDSRNGIFLKMEIVNAVFN